MPASLKAADLKEFKTINNHGPFNFVYFNGMIKGQARQL